MKDVDEAVGSARRAFAQVGVVGEGEKLGEKHRGLRGVVIAGLRGKRRQIEIVELGGVGDEIADFALADGSDGEDLQNLGEEDLGTSESVYTLFRVEEDVDWMMGFEKSTLGSGESIWKAACAPLLPRGAKKR